MSKKTRSTLAIDAVAQAAAESAVHAFSPARRVSTIAGLAGFVLRLFRGTQTQDPRTQGERTPKATRPGTKRIRTDPKPNRTGSEARPKRHRSTPPGSAAGLAPRGAATLPSRNGGPCHG